MPPARSPRALVPVLIFIGTVVAVISSLGAPLIPAIAERTGASLPQAQWALTVTLLVGAVATPVVGRLGDGPNRRAVVLVVLGLVTLGGALAALPLGLGWLIAGRGLQGFGLGLTPIAIAIARDTLAGERSRSTVAALSVTVVTGVGFGYPTAGLIAELGGVHAAFWTGAAISFVALLCAAAVLPPSPDAPARRLDVVGALLLGTGLAGLLLALGEAETWGARSPVLWVLAGVAVLLLVGWVRWESRTAVPLVDLRLARGRVAGTAHVAALLIGLANYLLLASIPILAQAPSADGAGFGTSIVVAGLILLPFSLASVASGRIARLVADRVGTRPVLPLAALVQSGAFVLFLVARGQLWELFVADGGGRARRRRGVRGLPRADHLRRPPARDRQRDEPEPGAALRRVRGGQRADRDRPGRGHSRRSRRTGRRWVRHDRGGRPRGLPDHRRGHLVHPGSRPRPAVP